MSLFVMRLPDVGEGVAEAELVEWLVAVGDAVTPETAIAEVLTDKATIEVSSPVTGQVVELHGEPGDVLAVGGDLIVIETEQAASPADSPEPPTGDDASDAPETAVDTPVAPDPTRDEPDIVGVVEGTAAGSIASAEVTESVSANIDRVQTGLSLGAPRPTAAPTVRARAVALAIDLSTVTGSGPDGRVLHADLDRALVGGAGGNGRSRTAPPPTLSPDDGRPEPVRGVRRQIARRLSMAWSEIPHITYVDDVDMTELERLRVEMNAGSAGRAVRLTILPYVARAMVVALADQPAINAHYDHESEVLTTFDAVHIGVATQTDDGLRVPVVRHAEARGVWSLATEIDRVATAARDGSATRDELGGSTITLTSLGALGGLVSTPIINPPELAIIGVNRMEIRPVWQHESFQPRRMMNLSSSFDHRMVDGWDAATFIGRIKHLLETPALLFVTDD